ncbi:glycosyltransferase family protein [Rubidibacter lacunae]|nr:hypothetical protein [Rubidibacter lacunae]
MTWVRPVVQALRRQLPARAVRVSVVLSPCPHATGMEAAVARQLPGVDRVQPAEAFWRFLLWGQTAERWTWRSRGVVLFLGGDRFFAVWIARRLGYRTIIYAEWDAQWWRWVDRIAAMRGQTVAKLPARARLKVRIVGDLMAEVERVPIDNIDVQTIGLLVGSKSAKLTQGVPLCLAIAEQIRARRPQVRFIIPVAPTQTPEAIAHYADPQRNPAVALVGGSPAQLEMTGDRARLRTPSGLAVELRSEFPPHGLYASCHLCLTTVGANTAELGALGVPMVVLLPTQQLDAMRAWDGLPGLLANLPGIGKLFAVTINWLILRRKRLYAWPNIWAGREIVPELCGRLRAEEVAALALALLEHPKQLEAMRTELRAASGQPGAADAIASLVVEELDRTRE